MRVYARKARLVLSSTFVEFVFFFFEFLFEFMLLSRFMLLLPAQIFSPQLLIRTSHSENLYSRKLAIQESTHFRFVILVVILSTAKINFLINFSLSFVILVIPDCLKPFISIPQCHLVRFSNTFLFNSIIR